MSRKLLTLVCSSLLVVLSFGQDAFAQADVRVVNTAGTVLPDGGLGLDGKVGRNATYTFNIEAQNATGNSQDGATLGFVIYSPDGSANASIVNNIHMLGDWATSAWWNLPAGLVDSLVDGSLPEQLLTGGASIGGGFPVIGWTPILTFDITMADVENSYICIDSAFFPPAGEWLMTPDGSPTWAGGNGDGAVGGSSPAALCYEIFTIPDLPPVFGTCPLAANGSHCDPIQFAVSASDPDPENQAISYSASTDGAGSVNVDGAGNVTYLPDPADVGASVTVTVTASEPDGPSADCVVDVTVENVAPVATCPPDLAVSKGNSATSPAAGVADPDACDSHVWSLVSVNPAPTGTVSVDPATGAVTFDSDVADAVGGADTDYDICLEVSDGIETDQCCMVFTVLNTEPFCISIEQTDKDENLNTLPGTLQGHQEEICIVYDAGSNEIGGFDFLISYDNSVLSLVGATEGSIYADYEWEYFTYRYGPNGNCNGVCPSVKVRIVGLAEQNDGMHHPNNLQLVPGDTFACLTFLVSNDRNYGCQFAPIRWCWLDCGDNALSSGGGDTTYISREVYDYIGTDNANVLHEFRADITGADPTFPTLTGAPEECDVRTEKGAPIRFVCFENGGIKIICPEDIDDRGDVNLNGLSNEIADAVMFTEYFISGLSAFVPHIEGSIAATEVNGDGIPLTVADLVYLIRVIVGDALPLPKSVHNTASITVAGDVVSTNIDLGAALFVFEGTANVELLATNMDMKVGVVDGNTHALVYSISTESIAAGGVVSADANLLSVEAASYEGVALDVITDVLPTEFAVYQNYPNPFNPSTKIAFDLPTPAAYQISIYNVAGQLVDVINGESVGRVVEDWNATAMASGVYFYKVEALGLSMTKKMMLLK